MLKTTVKVLINTVEAQAGHLNFIQPGVDGCESLTSLTAVWSIGKDRWTDGHMTTV